jgi:hypothetical protein
VSEEQPKSEEGRKKSRNVYEIDLNCSYDTLEFGFYVSIETKNPTQSTISQRLESEEGRKSAGRWYVF